MSAITHQMIALLTAFWLLTIYPLSAGIIIGALSIVAVMIGALTPDLDQPTANIWRRLLGGRALGNIFQFFSGGHRHVTHSLIGIILIGYLLHQGITTFINPAFVPSMLVLWRAFMIGYISHPIADTITDRGVPWFWPLHINIKIPPGPEELRVTTDSIVETLLVRGAVIISFILLLISHWPALLLLFR
ncbi:MAG: metal-dependent hydrolase [bacterium]|nr:metal-dependent hydrolase [bacterium]MDZ4347775.1 metal-dependent hydrolase [Candidatus Binatia bacterium]